MSRSAAPLGSLRSPRRAAERKSGHFTCYENRTFYLLPTVLLRERRPYPIMYPAFADVSLVKHPEKRNGAMTTTQRFRLPISVLSLAVFLFSQACFDEDPT